MDEIDYTHTKTMPDGTVLDIVKLNELMTMREAGRISTVLLDVSTTESSGYSEERLEKVDVTQPIIVRHDGFLLDGRHRVLKLNRQGIFETTAYIANAPDVRACTIKAEDFTEFKIVRSLIGFEAVWKGTNISAIANDGWNWYKITASGTREGAEMSLIKNVNEIIPLERTIELMKEYP